MNQDLKRSLLYTALLSAALASGLVNAQDATAPASEKKKTQASGFAADARRHHGHRRKARTGYPEGADQHDGADR